MKKAVVIGSAVVMAGIVFPVALLGLVNARGGVNPAQSGLRKLPVIGGLVKVKEPAPSVDQTLSTPTPGAAPGDDNLPYLRFGAQARLSQLADELESKKADYEARLQQLERKGKELETWERQLKVERDNLRQKFEKEKTDLAAERQQLEQKQADLAAQQLEIDANEESNLKATAAIYDKMDPEQAAAILANMYADSQQQSVVKIISMMQERSAAKTLAAFTDSKISAQITEQLQRITKPRKVGG